MVMLGKTMNWIGMMVINQVVISRTCQKQRQGTSLFNT